MQAQPQRSPRRKLSAWNPPDLPHVYRANLQMRRPGRRARQRKSYPGTRLAQGRCRFNPNLSAEKTMNDRFWEKRPDEPASTPAPTPPIPAPSVDESMNRVRTAADQAAGTVRDTAQEAVAGIKDGVREI